MENIHPKMSLPHDQVATSAAELSVLLHDNWNRHDLLGQILLKKNLILPESLRWALQEQQNFPQKRLGEILIEHGVVKSPVIQNALIENAAMLRVKLDDFDIDLDAVRLVPFDMVQNMQVMPLMLHDNFLVLAASETPDREAQDLLRFAVEHPLLFVLASQEEIGDAINRHYQILNNVTEIEVLEQSSVALADAQRIWNNADQLAKKAPLVLLVDSILHDAINQRASDIHFRPSEHEVELLYRIDGTLVSIRKLKHGLLPAVVSRIKILSNLNIAEHRLPQDGRIKIKQGSLNIDLRISIIPMQFGESVVIRVLNKNDGLRSIAQIGFSNSDQDQLRDLLARSYGIVLVTGPTGSGKSTTLYAALQAVNNEGVNVVTVEDPIEYELANTRQIQLIQQINFGFPQALRHILRHDPDVIMIGEIRDEETCKIAIESALTGHLVLSTLHTNDAPSAIVRLMEIGIAPYMIQSAVIGILAQRLVRCNCPDCLAEEEIPHLIRQNLHLPADEKFYRGTGCKHCRHTGFKGRMAIYELLVMNDTIRARIQPGVASDVFRTLAVNSGMITMPVHGVEQARLKRISITEVYRSCM